MLQAASESRYTTEQLRATFDVDMTDSIAHNKGSVSKLGEMGREDRFGLAILEFSHSSRILLRI